ncbi:MAG: SGNH/GDSL hydrolase family protein [Candidatus Magasanikbacteria bacterium]|nr:SGNH/GDSL hydrolase family protein [Candidatus Magasanikbacteria bacterium]
MYENVLIPPSWENPVTVGENNKKQAPAITYVALGDSLTAGTGVSNIEATYPYKIASALAAQEGRAVNLFNLAVSGATSLDLLENQAGNLKDLKPDIVTILIGVNDVHAVGIRIGQFRANLEKIIDLAKAARPKKIVVGTVPFIGSKNILWPPYDKYFAAQSRRYSEVVREIASKNGVTAADFSETFDKKWRESDYYAEDNFHLNEDGHNILANIFYASFNW